MRRMFLLSLALVSMALAGCFQSDVEPPAVDPATDNASVTIDEARPDPVFEDVVTGPSEVIR